MKINDYKMYKDGGSIEVDTNRGTYCFDYRINSATKGRLFRGYPKDDMSNLIDDSREIEIELWGELKKYDGFENDKENDKENY
jgi:hypothetical protein